MRSHSELRIGPKFQRLLLDPHSEFWAKVANYDVVPVAFQSPSGQYIACNRSFENMVGRALEDIIEATPAKLFDAPVSQRIEEAFNRTLTTAERTTCAFWQRFHHGPLLFVHCALSPVFGSDGLVGLISFFLNATQHFLTEESLRSALSLLRHDLSAPLAGMLMSLEGLKPAIGYGSNGVGEKIAVVSDLLNAALKLVEAWTRVPEIAEQSWNGEFRASTLWELGRSLEDKLRAICFSRLKMDLGGSQEARIYFASDLLVEILARLVLYAQPVRRKVSALKVSLRAETVTDGVLVRLNLSNGADQLEALGASVFSDAVIIRGLSLGLDVRFEYVDSTVQYRVRVPALYWGRDPGIPNRSRSPVVLDYEGTDFLSPGSLYCGFFDLMGHVVGIFSYNGILKACSYEFACSLGSTPEELIGKPYRELVADHVVAVLDAAWAECERQIDRKKTIVSISVPLCLNERFGHYEIHVSNAAEGGRVVLLTSVRDRIRVYKLLEVAMERGVVHLEQLLGRVSNELGSLLSEGANLDSSLVYDLQLLRQEADYTRGVLAHWQRMGQIERGEYQLDTRPVDLIRVLRTSLFERRLDSSVLRLPSHANGPDATDRYLVPGDESLLYTLFDNLLRNAQRAARGGLIEVVVEQEEDRIRVSVRNAGETPEYLRKFFFEKFVKGADSPGAGLGTYSARLVTELHRGRIWLDCSEPGYTTVHVELPRLATSAAQP